MPHAAKNPCDRVGRPRAKRSRTPPDRNDHSTSQAAVTPAIVVASSVLSRKPAQVVEHRAEADDRRHERRAEARGLRGELLPPVVVRAGRRRLRREALPEVRLDHAAQRERQRKRDEQRDARTCRRATIGAPLTRRIPSRKAAGAVIRRRTRRSAGDPAARPATRATICAPPPSPSASASRSCSCSSRRAAARGPDRPGRTRRATGFSISNSFQRSRPSHCQRISSPFSKTTRTSTGKQRLTESADDDGRPVRARSRSARAERAVRLRVADAAAHGRRLAAEGVDPVVEHVRAPVDLVEEPRQVPSADLVGDREEVLRLRMPERPPRVSRWTGSAAACPIRACAPACAATAPSCCR